MLIPGAHRCVCAELMISNLAVTAIHHSETLLQLEGTSGGALAAGRCGPAFMVLKRLVDRLVVDVTNRKNRQARAHHPAAAVQYSELPDLEQGADIVQKLPEQGVLTGLTVGGCCRTTEKLVNSLWRWLCSSSSALGLPALRAEVSTLVHKLLAQLGSKLGKLSATVVAADTTSIIIATNKQTLSAAVGCNFPLSG